MAITAATDNDLRQLIYKHEYVIVKYLDEDCQYCKLLAPPYEKYSDDPQYKDILFLKVDSGENPVAKSEVGGKDMPFFSIYKSGFLLECGSVRTEEGVKDMLHKLISS